MESVGALGSPTGANSNLLGLPSPWDEDDESLGREGIRPKSSPVPRRRSSASSDDSQPPPSSSRRVSFADTFGLNLVSVKQFDAWAVTVPPDPLESHLKEVKEYFMVPLFALPQTRVELEMRVLEKKIELENLELLPGTTTLRGVIRVLNLCFDKMVYVRTSLDSWRSHFDLLAEYVPGSHVGEMDCFSFKLTLVPPFGEEGARVDFCLRYETSLGTFWANNNENNFAFYCCEKTKEKPQNESENRRKSCLRGSSSNVSALTTNNMEFPDISPNSGQATDPEPHNTNADELQKEEISKNRSRRNRRKTARLAKVKEHFARREEERKHGTKTTGSEVTTENSVQEHASVPAEDSCSLSQQTPPGPPTYNQISPAPAECLEFAELKEDSTCTVTFKQRDLEQHVQDAVIHHDTDPSTAQTDSYLDETDDLSDQLVSVNPPVLGRQHDLSTGKDVEKAWKDFEQDAKQRIRCEMDKEENTSKEKPANRENVSLKTNHSVPQLFSQDYVFGTIVAPLYHQFFKNIQSERKDFIQRAFQEDRTFKELNDGSPRAVTPPESDQPPMRQNTEIGLESFVSTKQTQHDGESTEQNPANTKKETKMFISDPYRDVQGALSSHSCIKEHSTDPTNNQSQTKVETISFQTNVIGNNLPLNISNQFPQDSQNPRNTHFVVPQNDFNYFPTQTQQQITSILNPKQVELPQSVISERSPEISNLSAMPLVQTENTYNLPQSSEGPKMFQTSSNTFDSSDDQSDSDYSEMRLNNEILHFPESECSKAVKSYHINESSEQMTVAFSSQPQIFNITDGTNDFYGEHDSTTMIEEIENIQKGKLGKKYEKECHILEDLVEEEKANQAIQIDNQEVNQKQKEEQESAKGEEIGGGIWNIVDELKYIDDEEDIDMGTVEMESKQNQQSDFNHQSHAVVQPSNSVNLQSYAVNDSVNQQSDSVNEQSNSENQQSDLVNQQSDSMNQQSDLENQQSESENQQSDSVKQQSNSVNQQSDSVNEQSHSGNQQSDSENQKSYVVTHASDSVNQQSDLENQQSESENQQTDSVEQQSNSVNQQSDSENQPSENQQSDSENQQSDSENQQSDSENQQSDSENQQSDSVNRQSDLVHQQSDSVNQQSDSVNQQSDSETQESQQSDWENQQSELENQRSDSIYIQSDSLNEQSHSDNQQSDSENQQSDLVNRQSVSVNRQSDLVHQQSDLVHQQSDSVHQQSDSVNQQSDPENHQSDSENHQSDPENHQSDPENHQSDPENERSDLENQQSDPENQQSDLVNRQSDSVNRQSDLVNQQSDSVNHQSDPENQQSDPENQQSDPENERSDLENERSVSENQQSDPENERSDLENERSVSENQQSDLVNRQSDLVNQQSDSVNQQSDPENQQSDPENQQSDQENERSDLENERSVSENQQSDPENQRSDPENERSDSENHKSDSENHQSVSENLQSDPENERSDFENQQGDLVNHQADSVNQQSDSANRQSDSENRQSDSENQQLDSENQQLDSENQQLDSENQQLDSENQQLDSENQQLDSENQQLDSENQQLDSENQQSDSMSQQANSVHQQTIEQQPKPFIIKSNSESLQHSSIEFDIAEEHQSTEQSRSGDEDSSSAEAADEETDTFWNESTTSGGDALSASIHGMRNDWDHLDFIDKELTVCCESEKLQNKCKPNDENMQENMECLSKDYTDAEKDVEDNTSTESLVDDEMELYLTCLRNSQQSVFRDGLANVNYGKRPSVSRGRSMSLSMPSISESVDEDQPNSSLEKASNTEDITELERATLTPVEGNEHAIGCNVLWWKEFLSYDNMPRVVGYSFLLILFFVVAYYYDFAACFVLYLLTVYLLFKQPEEEPVKGSRRGERQL